MTSPLTEPWVHHITHGKCVSRISSGISGGRCHRVEAKTRGSPTCKLANIVTTSLGRKSRGSLFRLTDVPFSTLELTWDVFGHTSRRISRQTGPGDKTMTLCNVHDPLPDLKKALWMGHTPFHVKNSVAVIICGDDMENGRRRNGLRPKPAKGFESTHSSIWDQS